VDVEVVDDVVVDDVVVVDVVLGGTVVVVDVDVEVVDVVVGGTVVVVVVGGTVVVVDVVVGGTVVVVAVVVGGTVVVDVVVDGTVMVDGTVVVVGSVVGDALVEVVDDVTVGHRLAADVGAPDTTAIVAATRATAMTITDLAGRRATRTSSAPTTTKPTATVATTVEAPVAGSGGHPTTATPLVVFGPPGTTIDAGGSAGPRAGRPSVPPAESAERFLTIVARRRRAINRPRSVRTPRTDEAT
jgi:hypothetical protein